MLAFAAWRGSPSFCEFAAALLPKLEEVSRLLETGAELASANNWSTRDPDGTEGGGRDLAGMVNVRREALCRCLCLRGCRQNHTVGMDEARRRYRVPRPARFDPGLLVMTIHSSLFESSQREAAGLTYIRRITGNFDMYSLSTSYGEVDDETRR